MNREIKFRAWIGMLEKMAEDFQFCASFEEDGSLNIAPTVEVMQYSGLKDKNGKEIYEGDIIEAFPIMKLDDTKIKGTVVFNEVMARWIVVDTVYGDTEHLFEITKHPCKEAEIIGNIYENPELINH